jgi:hypothetical protein
LNNELARVHTIRSKLGCHEVNVDHYKHQRGNKTGNTEQKSNNCDTEIIPLLPFTAKRTPFHTILWKERNRK